MPDPLSLLAAFVWLMAAGMYPLGFLFGTCSDCCSQGGEGNRDEGACCEGATCSIKPQWQCQGDGKIFRGVGTLCDANLCCCGATPAATLTQNATLTWTGEWSFVPQAGQFPQRPADSGVVSRSYALPTLGSPIGEGLCTAFFGAASPSGDYTSEWEFFPGATFTKNWIQPDQRTAVVLLRATGAGCFVQGSVETNVLFDHQANGDPYHDSGISLPYALGQTAYTQTYWVFGNDVGQMFRASTNTMPTNSALFQWDGVVWRITVSVSL